jgi:hypothetical protein
MVATPSSGPVGETGERTDGESEWETRIPSPTSDLAGHEFTGQQ